MRAIKIVICSAMLLFLSGCFSAAVGIASDVAVGTVKAMIKVAKAPF